MCGIVAALFPSLPEKTLTEYFLKGQQRGPDNTTSVYASDDVWLGFHRLAINGLDDASNQPFYMDGIYLICNGEIYNYKELYATLGITPQTNSDCEVILHLYKQFGIEHAVHAIDASEFAFVLYDTHKQIIHVARDPYGVRPLYQGRKKEMLCFASELKMLPPLDSVEQFPPGSIMSITKYRQTITKYCSLPSLSKYPIPNSQVYETLYACVKKRVMTTERPMACLLSGGLDSSIIAYLVNKCRKELNIETPLETYSIGLPEAEDLKFAEIMATFLGSNHTSVILSEKDFLDAIPEVIHSIESRDTTTVRASVGNYLVCKYIKEHSEAKIIFNGDGADEVCGGYLYLKCAPSMIEFDKECRRLVSDIHLFDAQRSDRSISSHGLESRTPFLDRSFVELYMAIPPELRFTQCEKLFLRQAFIGTIPDAILWRKKEAFSDGVSSMAKSWFSIIQESIPTEIVKEHQSSTSSFTPEQFYYKKIYDSYFQHDLLPYFWMPKYTLTQDCSARTLETYFTQER
jgi:asparagine synthase (glutamine-hydrolysing)